MVDISSSITLQMYSAGDESGDSTVRLLPRRADPDAIRRSQYEFPKDRRPEKVPYRSIGLAVSLFFIGQSSIELFCQDLCVLVALLVFFNLINRYSLAHDFGFNRYTNKLNHWLV